ncbi:SDR family NAD(P)-dependent oxidoreductase [Bordetella hinzii]|uniref:SDR family NAD(P)-dependent oxidoreductase n=1 Tax=Bordetella hinzii TaxID=103855 RepID=UPI000422B192|nr:SDR family oxidoreductase [Bordetella hinzii]AKQ54341.1 Cyclopentanol dehydrogenase [Bordetella hinzii]KCB31926.1 KR domain protein [Bordetella hinzii L60]KCB32533.1 KR domain protein [Bordetella hinzii CA90 BAL1384]KCB49165.1 KR domain protein [Bordetella hinzii 4161]KCB52740.1 KR domain protein [Bordetella hinzii 1277]
MTTDLCGQVVVITGAAGDLGWGIARACLDAGARVALIDLDADALARLGQEGDERILRLQCDVADPMQTRGVVDAVLARWDRIDVLVNNAAVVTPGDKIGDLSAANWHQALAINLTGAWLMSKWALAPMRRARRGVVINVASQLGSVAAAGRGAYGASKAGLIALARAIAVDHADEGIRALSLSPGAVLTGRVLRRYGDAETARQALAPRYPIGRLGEVEEVARTALFLMGKDAAFITGTDVRVDGGYTAI